MTEKVLKCLYDKKIAAEEIDSFFETSPRDFENYKGNSLLKCASSPDSSTLQERTFGMLSDKNLFDSLIFYEIYRNSTCDKCRCEIYRKKMKANPY